MPKSPTPSDPAKAKDDKHAPAPPGDPGAYENYMRRRGEDTRRPRQQSAGHDWGTLSIVASLVTGASLATCHAANVGGLVGRFLLGHGFGQLGPARDIPRGFNDQCRGCKKAQGKGRGRKGVSKASLRLCKRPGCEREKPPPSLSAWARYLCPSVAGSSSRPQGFCHRARLFPRRCV